jgi:PAS domain-containing protein
MSDLNSTQVLSALAWRDPRAHLLDDTWLVTIFAVLIATALPWLLSGLAIDLLAIAVGLVALGAIHVAFAALVARGVRGERWRGRALTTLHALGILVIAFIWQHAGGPQNPLFLMVFTLPVIGSIFLSRWQPYLMSVLAAAAVALVAAIEVPELRWYLPGLNDAIGSLGSLLGRGGGAGLPFAGFYAPSEYYVVLLEAFAIMLIACAVAAEYLGSVFERLNAQIGTAWAEAERGQQLWATLLEQLPLPAFLLDANTAEVVAASAAALAKFETVEPGAQGRRFFDVLHFSYPEMVQELVSGAGGTATPCMLRLGERLCAAEVRVQHLAQKGRRFALVTVQDLTEALCVKVALDVAEQAAVVVNAQGRVLAFNRPASALFPGIEADAEVTRLLPQEEPQPRWWDPGLVGRRKAHVTIRQRVYQLTSSAVPLPGEDERLYVIAFLPATRVAAASEQSGTYTTLVQRP